MLNAYLKSISDTVFQSFVKRACFLETRVHSFSIVAVIAFPLYYYIWHDIFPQQYENLTLRLLGSAIFFPFIFIERWPRWIERHKLIYWYFAILYGLPFFFTFMLLKNSGATEWLLSTLIALFLMILLLDWLSLLIQSVLGVSLAWLAYFATTESPSIDFVTLESVPIYLFAIILGSISSYRSEIVQNERMDAMLATASNIAHELRTPLLGIRSGASGLQQFVPALLDGYRQAKAHGLAIEPIRPVHLHSLNGVLERIESEAAYSNIIIDMLLMNSRTNALSTDDLAVCSMVQCVDTALARYPFTSDKERELVEWNRDADFNFCGVELLTVHMLFNLIKNSLYYIAKANKGEISIHLKQTPHGNMLIFRDTGTGIPPKVLPHIFTRFYSWSPDKENTHNSGIGLAFCSHVMASFGGTIRCESQLGEYTEFTITFPPENPS